MAFTLDSRDSVVPTSRAQIHTSDVRALTDGLAGIGVLSGCAVTAQSTPDRTVAVASGSIRISGGASVAVTAGNVSCGTADSTNPRWILITASNAGVKTATAGTPAASPNTAKPDVPSGHVLLATVYDPASNATVVSGQITDKRVVLDIIGGIIAEQVWNGPPVILTSPTSNTDFDATNAAVTFFAPPSGNVDVEVFAAIEGTSAGADSYIVIRDGTTEKAARYFAYPSGMYFPFAACYHVTGLTPGTSYTFKLGARATGGNVRLEVSAAAGPLIMRVRPTV